MNSILDQASSSGYACCTEMPQVVFWTRRRGKTRRPPLSYLFIIALEVLAIRIRNDDTIQGFKFGDGNVKLNLFADTQDDSTLINHILLVGK